jgi:hypothetical protein
MEKLEKCVNFILTVPVFFATNCTKLFETVAAREGGGSGAAPSQKFIKEIRKIYSFKCVKLFIKD